MEKSRVEQEAFLEGERRAKERGVLVREWRSEMARSAVGRQGMSCTRGSWSQGEVRRMACVRSLRAPGVVARGPTTDRMLFCPSQLLAMPS